MLAASPKGKTGLATCMNVSTAKKNGQECVIRVFILVCLLTLVTLLLRDDTHRNMFGFRKNYPNFTDYYQKLE